MSSMVETSFYKKNLIVTAMFFFSLGAFAQSKTALDLIKAAEKKDNVSESIAYLEKNIPTLTSDSEKRAAFAFLGSVQEQLGLFTDAGKTFVKAAGLSGGEIAGLPKKTSEELVLDAVRCALSCGDADSADSYLSSVRSSKNQKTSAFSKLYEQWSALEKAENQEAANEIVAMLKTYKDLASMKDAKKEILLTLWHLTGEKTYSDELKKNYAGTLEEKIVSGKANLLPSPFWFFVPRKNAVAPETTTVVTRATSSKSDTTPPSTGLSKLRAEALVETSGTVAPGSSGSTVTTPSSKPRAQQLGLFGEEANAKNLVEKAKSKGFDAKIEKETRPSGKTYFIVVVPENEKGNTGDMLKTAGFECYPVF